MNAAIAIMQYVNKYLCNDKYLMCLLYLICHCKNICISTSAVSGKLVYCHCVTTRNVMDLPRAFLLYSVNELIQHVTIASHSANITQKRRDNKPHVLQFCKDTSSCKRIYIGVLQFSLCLYSNMFSSPTD